MAAEAVSDLRQSGAEQLGIMRREMADPMGDMAIEWSSWSLKGCSNVRSLRNEYWSLRHRAF